MYPLSIIVVAGLHFHASLAAGHGVEPRQPVANDWTPTCPIPGQPTAVWSPSDAQAPERDPLLSRSRRPLPNRQEPSAVPHQLSNGQDLLAAFHSGNLPAAECRRPQRVERTVMSTLSVPHRQFVGSWPKEAEAAHRRTMPQHPVPPAVAGSTRCRIPSPSRGAWGRKPKLTVVVRLPSGLPHRLPKARADRPSPRCSFHIPVRSLQTSWCRPSGLHWTRKTLTAAFLMYSRQRCIPTVDRLQRCSSRPKPNGSASKMEMGQAPPPLGWSPLAADELRLCRPGGMTTEDVGGTARPAPWRCTVLRGHSGRPPVAHSDVPLGGAETRESTAPHTRTGRSRDRQDAASGIFAGRKPNYT